MGIGVKVGGIPSRHNFWEEVIIKIFARLSKWKLKTLSIGDRFTLTKAVLSSIPLYQMSMYRVPMDVLNRLESTRRDFFNSAENKERKLSLISWKKNCRLRVKAMFGARWSLFDTVSFHWRSNWLDIIREFQSMSRKGLNLLSYAKLKSARAFIDNIFLPHVGAPTRWVSVVPIKINIFAWRLSLDKLHTRLNLSLRGIDIPSIICPICSIAGESSSYIFFNCHVARDLLGKVARCWELELLDIHAYKDWISWFITLRLPKRLKDILEGVFYTLWWSIWRFRNQVVFRSSRPRLDSLFDEVVQMGSILVNGSPTPEFQFYKGLKQGDPLSPFLFILVKESLHLSFHNVVSAGLFKGVNLDNSLRVSHLFYADDVVFVGQWCDSNLFTIIRVLDYFFRASGLRINLHKSKLIGIVVDQSIVEVAASNIGCMALNLPFSYLRIIIGGNMSRIKPWDDVINKVLCRLSKWKIKILSIGGRFTLFKSVLGASPIYFMSMFNAPIQVLKKLESIRNHFFNRVDSTGSSLWSRVIKLIHGEDGKIGKSFKHGLMSNWNNITRGITLLQNKGIDLLGYTKKKTGNKGKRTIDQVVDCIKSVVRLKLLSCKMRKSKSGERLARLWDLPEAIFV
ncbi:RNA-directed DNA polymerase, eukaryota, reverse transcriptase zinc-binding domain protein [Tanacetum coccineum]